MSTTVQEEGTSLDTQEEHCRARVTEDGFAVSEPHVYRETHTGTELWERPKLTALREAIRRREVDVVIAYAIDRLARDPVHLGVILSEAEHAGVEVRFVTEPFDNSPEGQLIRFVRGYAAKVEHEKIRERSIRGRIARAKAGKPIVGCRPTYGYAWTEDQTALIPDPLTAPIVQRIFAEAAAGKPLRAIAAGLTADSIPTPSRARSVWNFATVRHILTFPTYIGEAAAFRYKRINRTAAVRRPAEETLPLEDVAPPLVDRDTFALVSERLRVNKAVAARNHREPEAVLLRGGYATCGYCGSNLTTHRHSQTGNWNYVCDTNNRGLSCRGLSIKAEVLDAAAWARVVEIVTTPDMIAAKLAELQADDPTSADLAVLERSLSTVDRQATALTRRLALLEDDDAAALVARELQALTAQRRQLLNESEQVRARRAQWEAAQSRLRDISVWCDKLGKTIESLNYAGRRDLLFALDVKATVRRKSDPPRYIITADIPLGGDADNTVVFRTADDPPPRSQP